MRLKVISLSQTQGLSWCREPPTGQTSLYVTSSSKLTGLQMQMIFCSSLEKNILRVLDIFQNTRWVVSMLYLPSSVLCWNKELWDESTRYVHICSVFFFSLLRLYCMLNCILFRLINHEQSLLLNRLKWRYIGETVANCPLGIRMWIGRRQFTSTSSSISLTTLSPWQSVPAPAPRTCRCCVAIHRLVLLSHLTLLYLFLWTQKRLLYYRMWNLLTFKIA